MKQALSTDADSSATNADAVKSIRPASRKMPRVLSLGEQTSRRYWRQVAEAKPSRSLTAPPHSCAQIQPDVRSAFTLYGHAVETLRTFGQRHI